MRHFFGWMVCLVLLGATAVCGMDASTLVVRGQARFDVREAPAGRVDVYQSMQVVPPGAWMPAHTHNGIEAGFVISGTGSRWDKDGVHHLQPGRTFLSTIGSVHTVGNEGRVPMVQMTTHLIAAGSPYMTVKADAGAPVAAAGAATASNRFRSTFVLEALPAVPFRLYEFLYEMPAGAQAADRVPTGPCYGTVVEGVLKVTVDDRGADLSPGQTFQAAAGQRVRIVNAGGTVAECMVSCIAPARSAAWR